LTQSNAYIAPGTKVQLGADENGDVERGLVVSCWLEPSGFFDCYVAFSGKEFPEGKPAEVPYVLRYAAVSLKIIDD
jgi:hypothetical protein